MTEKNLVKAVPFHGQELAMVDHNGEPYVAMRPVCDGIGLEWARQSQKLTDQSEKFNCVHMPTVAADGKQREMVCIPLKKLNGWLFSINPEKVAEGIRDRVIAYQEECFQALYDYWHKGISLNPRKQQLYVDAHWRSHMLRKLADMERSVREIKTTFAVVAPVRHPFFERLEFGKGRVCEKQDLFDAFSRWHVRHGEGVRLGKNSFFKMLYDSGYPIRPGYMYDRGRKVAVMHGVSLKSMEPVMRIEQEKEI